MKTPILSICIATYNRANFIGETLDSIIPQLDDDVELLVVDGASSDNTEDVVRGYARKDSRIRYVRLSAKGGVDRDYDCSVELARGEFCWLFTDDDLLKPGAIAAVKETIKNGYDLMIVNAEVRDRELSVVLGQRRISMQENKTYDPGRMEHLFIDALHYLSFIGAVVIRRSIWLSRDRELYFGTEFVHVGVIFQKPLPGPAIIIAEPFIIIRFGNGQWTPRSFDIWMFKWPKLVWSFKDISDGAKRRLPTGAMEEFLEANCSAKRRWLQPPRTANIFQLCEDMFHGNFSLGWSLVFRDGSLLNSILFIAVETGNLEHILKIILQNRRDRLHLLGILLWQ